MKTYKHHQYPFILPAGLREGTIQQYPVAVVGAGPVGLTLALDLVRKGIKVLLLDDNNQVSTGSRAICFAKRSLEIFDRLGAAARMREKGITWNTGRLFYHDREVFHFNLLPEEDHNHPAFINLQQYYTEQYLLDMLVAEPGADIRWLSKVTAIEHLDGRERLTVDTPAGSYHVDAAYVLACDGSNSTLRSLLGLDYKGTNFEEQFLIADIVLKQAYPAERWFWFDPVFAPGQSVLLHRQPDNMLRIDFRLGQVPDRAAELQPAKVTARIKEMLGKDTEFELEWISAYTFQSRRLERFVHGRVLFAGDAAHLVSPFGARGANSGIQDADNLAWKLHLVLTGKAPGALLHTYDTERIPAAVENMAYTENSTAFIAPPHAVALAYRDSLLELASGMPQLRPLINSGRLSTPFVYRDLVLSTPDEDCFNTLIAPGAGSIDAPVIDGQDGKEWLLHYLGNDFKLLYYAGDEKHTLPLAAFEEMAGWPVRVQPLIMARCGEMLAGEWPVLQDVKGLVAARYDLQPGSCYLVRPDQHIAARWKQLDVLKLRKAVDKSCGKAKEAPAIPAASVQMPAALTGALTPADHDHFYRRYCDLHQGLGSAESAALNTKLILLLANELGDAARLKAILAAAAGR